MRFSIVVPTKDRASMLRFALESLNWQTFTDCEVIVSNNHSSDETANVIRNHARTNWTCVQPPHAMSMPDHWEFAVRHARGDWVLVLCDDDVLLPTALERLDNVLQAEREPDIVRYYARTFVYNDGVRETGNYMELPERIPFAVRNLDAKSHLQLNFWRPHGDMPKLLNCAVRRTLLDRIRDRYGRLFGAWAPDYNVGAKLLAECNSYLYVGTVAVFSENMASYGSGALRDPQHLLRFLRQFEQFSGGFEHSPYPDVMTVSNAVFDTLQIVRRELGPRYDYLAINPIRFRREVVKDAQRYVKLGFDEYQAVVDRVQRDIRRESLLELCVPSRIGRRRAQAIEMLRFQWNRWRQKPTRKQEGLRQRCHFPDILAAAREVERRLDPLQATGHRRSAA